MMDARTQADGARRVRDLLVEPLMRRGLAKPGNLTRAQFDAMLADLCARLAYMAPAHLAALEEQAAARPSGKGKDRFPIANDLLRWAAAIEPPPDDASPLVRAVFAHDIGAQAIAEGWAPELLDDVLRMRRWPGAYVLKTLRDSADDARRRHHQVGLALAGGGPVSPEDAAWHARRTARIDKCRRIAALAAAPDSEDTP